MTSRVEPLDPHVQRAIVAWVVVATALRDRARILDRGRAEAEIYDALQEWLGRHTAAELNAVHDETELEIFLQGLVDGLAAEAEMLVQRRGPGVQALFDDVMEHVRDRVSSYQAAENP